MLGRRRLALAAATAAAATPFAPGARAQPPAFPSRPVRVLVPAVAAGG